jgi:hypothetical protein
LLTFGKPKTLNMFLMAISFTFLIIDIPAGCSFFINEFLPKNFFKLAAKKCYLYMYEIKIFLHSSVSIIFFSG